MKSKRQPDDMATIDHLYSRFSEKRHEPCNGELRRVIACFRCNNDRARDEQKTIPIEELRVRSKQHEEKKAKRA